MQFYVLTQQTIPKQYQRDSRISNSSGNNSSGVKQTKSNKIDPQCAISDREKSSQEKEIADIHELHKAYLNEIVANNFTSQPRNQTLKQTTYNQSQAKPSHIDSGNSSSSLHNNPYNLLPRSDNQFPGSRVAVTAKPLKYSYEHVKRAVLAGQVRVVEPSRAKPMFQQPSPAERSQSTTLQRYR